MRYYLLNNRVLFQDKDDNGDVSGFGVKQPLFMKKYPYYKIAFKADGSQCIVQSEGAVPEAKELTIKQAQAQIDTWVKTHEKRIKTEEVFDKEKQETVVVKSEVTPTVSVAHYDRKEIKEEMARLHQGVLNG